MFAGFLAALPMMSSERRVPRVPHSRSQGLAELVPPIGNHHCRRRQNPVLFEPQHDTRRMGSFAKGVRLLVQYGSTRKRPAGNQRPRAPFRGSTRRVGLSGLFRSRCQAEGLAAHTCRGSCASRRGTGKQEAPWRGLPRSAAQSNCRAQAGPGLGIRDRIRDHNRHAGR